MQKFKSFLLALIITMTSSMACITTAYAASDSSITPESSIGISPFYLYAGFVETNLRISGKTATISISLDGNSSAKSIKASYSLQKKSGSSWSTVKTWPASSSNRFLNAKSEYNSLVAGAQYRAYAVYTVTGTDGRTETITDYSSTYTC